MPKAASKFSQHRATQTAQSKVFRLNTTPESDGAVIDLRMAKRPGSFLIDTGASINVIKESAAKGLPTRKNRLEIIGISGDPIVSGREAGIDIYENRHPFAIVPDSFPIEEDGIIGMPFLLKENAVIDYPARKIIFQIQAKKQTELSYLKERSQLLQENTRLQHIQKEQDREGLWEIIDQHQDIFVLPGRWTTRNEPNETSN